MTAPRLLLACEMNQHKQCVSRVNPDLTCACACHGLPVHDRYCTTCESTHDGTETPRGLAWTCGGCGERQEYRA